MGTIGTTALLGRLVDLDVLHDQVAGVETLGIGVRFGVFEQAEEEFGGFLGPAGAGDAELFAWFLFGGVSDFQGWILFRRSVASEGHGVVIFPRTFERHSSPDKQQISSPRPS